MRVCWLYKVNQYCDTVARKFNTILGYIKRCVEMTSYPYSTL